MAQISSFRRAEKLETTSFAYSGFSGGGSGGGNMEVRVARLESDVEHIKIGVSDIKIDLREMRTSLAAEMSEIRRDARTDFRLTFGALIAVALGLAGLMAKGFGWLG